MKYISVPDFHFDIDHIDISTMCGKAVRDAADKHSVDFIAIPGDWFNRPLLANNKGGLKAAKDIMRSWLEVCPVCAIEGTVPRHDSRGAYGIFEEMGLVLLQPGKVYGYIKTARKIVEQKSEDFSPSAILFGIPELTKDNIQAQLNLPAEQANAEALNLFNDYIESFVAPMRLKYKDIPAIGLLHGNVTDSISKETETDRILKRSEILISTEILEKADLTYFNLGHLHNPWSSKRINASYAGSPGFTWNETGFLPAFEMIEIETFQLENREEMILIDHYDHEVKDITRIPYGTPSRYKVNSVDQIQINPNYAYWLESDTEELPEGIHPWSRKTAPQTKRETQRIDEKQAENIKSLWDLFKLCDPEVKDELKDKVDLITESVKKINESRLDVQMTYLKVSGCDFFEGRTVEFSIGDILGGLNSIHGEIGSGKSSLLSFCSPYPIVIGKETQSGRQSAIKDFFSGQESKIEKRFIVNGQEHQHIIDIAKAHTQNPKVECYLNIDGKPQLDRGTFDEMLAECEKLYGSFEDYRLTSFYEQPQQSTKNQSGLMTAGRTEARNIVQNTAGIDREQEKRFALDRVADCENKTSNLRIQIDTRSGMLESVDDINIEIDQAQDAISACKEEIEAITKAGNDINRDLDNLIEQKKENDIKIEKRINIQRQMNEIDINTLNDRIIEAQKAADSLALNKKLLGDISKASARIQELKEQCSTIEKANSELKELYWKDKTEYDKLVTSNKQLESMISNAKDKVKTLELMIDRTKQPCEKCGHIAASAQKIIDEYKLEIEQHRIEITEAEKEILPLPPAPTEPTYQQFDDHELNNLLSSESIDTTHLQQEIEIGIRAESLTNELLEQIQQKNRELKNLRDEYESIKIDISIDPRIEGTKKALESTRLIYTEKKSELTRLETELNHAKQKLEQLESQKAEIEKQKNDLEKLTADLEDWQYISKMLNPDKIPSLELDIIVSSIDTEATKIISPFMESRYSFQTITQDMGKKAMVDRFDIIIHDAETGEQKSMFFKNPGHKAFFSDAYIKALIKKREEKAQISYSPIILDEADGPISPKQIPYYYEIQNEYFKNEKVLIVSHSSDAQQFIQNTIEIEELKG